MSEKIKRARPENTIDLELDNLKASVTLFGATVLSFSIGEKEILFLSEKAVLNGTKPIRGGIPIVFPHFGAGDGTLPSHGFARTSMWKILQEVPGSVVLGLSWKDPLSSDAWKFPFNLEYTIQLTKENGGSLKTSLRIMNVGLVGEDQFSFQCLQHTYLNIPKIADVSVHGLAQGSFINQLANREIQILNQDILKVDREVDWIFLGNQEKQEVVVGRGDFGVSIKFSLNIASNHVPCDIVVWNPWIEKSKKLADFGDEEYNRMICIEPGNVSRFDTLKGGEDAVLTQVLSLV